MNTIEIAKLILSNAKEHKLTTVLATIAVLLAGGGKVMAEHGLEPWGTAVAGLGALLVLVLGAVARDPKKVDPNEPPK